MKRGRSHWKSGQAMIVALTVLTIALLGTVAPSQAQVPAAQVVWQHVGRVYLDPNTGKAVYAGYLVHLNGLPSSLFNGAPSEATAHFTFSTDVLQLTPLPSNGDVALTLVSAGTFNVYYNAVPSGNWNNPSSFSSGQLIATFTREESLFPQMGAFSFHSLSEVLTLSSKFIYNGQKYNLKDIAPNGITFAQFFSNTPLSGVAGYPIAFAAAGTTIAVGEPR